MAEPTQRIAHFRIESMLGRGGMGVVYRAVDEKLGREVAVKVLAQSATGDTQARARMLREARAAASIVHRNIATVYEIGEDDGRFYIAMEMVRGRSLRAILAGRERPMPVEEIVPIARAIATALSKAHAAGIVHRDLKPDNVLVAEDGEVKLVDFGIAKLLPGADDGSGATLDQKSPDAATLTATGGLVGTPGYMAPEAFGAGGVDARADVFALGVVLYEMLTNTRAFRGGSTADTIRRVLFEVLPSPRSLEPGTPPGLDALVMRCLAKARSERVPSAVAFLEELDRPVEDQAITTTAPTHPFSAPAAETPRPPTPGVALPPPRMPSRGRWLFAVAGMGVLGGVVALVVGRGPSAPKTVSVDAAVVDPFRDEAPVAACGELAKREYHEGMRALHDVGRTAATDHFRAAATADPRCAVAQLRVALTEKLDGVQRRELQRALGMRAALPPREAALAAAYTPLLEREPSDTAATSRALVALADERPRDAELQVLASQAALEASDARRLAERTRLADPSYAAAFDALADAALREDDPAAARAALDECEKQAPAANVCLDTSMDLSWRIGDCARLATEARQYNLRTDNGTSGYAELAFAASSLDPEGALVGEAIDQWEHRMPEHLAFVAAAWRVALAIELGDFKRANVDLSALSARLKGATELDPHVRVGTLKFELLVERGDDAGAARFAADFLSRQTAWTRPVRPDVENPSCVYFEPRMGSAVLASPLHERWSRERWQRDAALPESLAWAYGKALFVRGEADARDAMASAPKAHRLPYLGSGVELLLGRTALLAGDPAAAITHLERASARCDALSSPFEHVRASLWLGKAREARGDSAGACSAYSAVLKRWGKANARSVTAEEAALRVRGLGCP